LPRQGAIQRERARTSNGNLHSRRTHTPLLCFVRSSWRGVSRTRQAFAGKFIGAVFATALAEAPIVRASDVWNIVDHYTAPALRKLAG
jgi:hypothetical protein